MLIRWFEMAATRCRSADTSMRYASVSAARILVSALSSFLQLLTRQGSTLKVTTPSVSSPPPSL